MYLKEKGVGLNSGLFSCAPIQNISDNPIKDAIHYIENNFGRKICIEEVAQYALMSVFYFSRIFKKETGYSPYEYITKTRLDHAKRLLKSTSFSIKEIAFLSGFGSESNFVYTFRSNEGVTPGEFRNQNI